VIRDEAIFKLKKGKAAGKSGILLELILDNMVEVRGGLWLRLLDLIRGHVE